ncbi:MAG: aminomethyl-transferring glycine dehydrogenase subunit GcvPA [Anaerolineae bacterium]|jgi:glycine dehydrogenase subunit 1|nr:aminomethyl-transferring glycine dehydrogenase subunit GcvPA [Chloroflexota bacterium]
MTYLPLTDRERVEMLARIGVPSTETLFQAVPEEVRYPELRLPAPLSEPEILAELRALGAQNVAVTDRACFLGAGACNHFVPSIVAHITSRSEFYTAYTPYQPEISQGTLQVIFEYQTMIARLTGMDVSNASHYDGATALAESLIMAQGVARGRRSRAVLAPSVNPVYREVARTYLQGTDVEIIDEGCGVTPQDWAAAVDDRTACLVVQTPDFYGRILDLRGIAEAVHARGALLIVLVDPISLGMLVPPGALGADIVIGDGQPLGIGLQYGGPYLGFFACRAEHVRRMSGRVVGQTVDVEGKRGFVMTLVTREQHIRREKATSNICTNQGLNVLAAAVYLSALGRSGLSQVANLCYQRAHYAASAIDALPGYSLDGDGLFFKEFVVHCPLPVQELNRRLLDEFDIIGGLDLSTVEAGRERDMLVCVTEMNPRAQIDRLVAALAEVAK